MHIYEQLSLQYSYDIYIVASKQSQCTQAKAKTKLCRNEETKAGPPFYLCISDLYILEINVV